MVAMRSSPSSFQVMVLGNSAVGKSAYIERFIRQHFAKSSGRYKFSLQERSTITLVTKAGEKQSLELWDSYGEDYIGLRDMCIKYCDGFIIMYSIDDIDSFNNITKYKSLLERIQERDTIPILLIGNKLDKEKTRTVSIAQAQKFALEIGAGHLETSVVNGINIELGLLEITSMITEHRKKTVPKKPTRRNSVLSPILKRMRVRSSSLSSLFSSSSPRLPTIEPLIEPTYEPQEPFHLPDELWLMIFKHLPYKSLGLIPSVCRRWNNISKDEEMKRYFYEQKMISLHILSKVDFVYSL